ncbi:hypothetical protein AAFF_G00429750 [Aldrovandia affinis]|uniref:Platelet-activating factor receptor n=1 Tax=Aldrovandia affinis TaxID=143900 RepID=A0AAD7S8T4_9TELE|nr:hypothetical protein AAFF_G00429750 [Aldrovandia affinis]
MPGSVVNSSGNDTDRFLDSEFRYTLFPIFYSFVFIFGLTANLGALFVLRHLRNAKAMNEIRIYMTNLTVADLLFVCVLPLWISYYKERGHWAFSDALCRITGTMFFINTYCSVLFLTVISFNRYWAITQPLDAASSDHRRRGILVSVAIWVATLSAAVFYLVEPGTNDDALNGNVTRCFEGYHQEESETKQTLIVTHFIIVAFFFLVFLLVVVCNLLICRTLMAQRLKQVGRQHWRLKKHALWMVCVVLAVFVVCFVPHHVVQGPWTMAVLKLGGWEADTRQRLNDAHQVTLMLMGLNCLLDPVVYCFATRKFRRFVASWLRRMRNAPDCASHTASTNMSVGSQRHAQLVPLEPPRKE